MKSGIPFLSGAPVWHPLTFDDEHEGPSFRVLDVVDVVVSKLKRFSATDASDIDAMIAMDLVEHAQLVKRFESAADR